MQVESSLNIQQKLLEISMGDYKMESRLAGLYYKSFQDLKDLFAVSLIKQDEKLLSFIRHKYGATFQMLQLPKLAREIDEGVEILTTTLSEEAISTSIDKVKSQCDRILAQLIFYYPWLS